VQRSNLPVGWVISNQPAHQALVSEADYIAAQPLHLVARETALPITATAFSSADGGSGAPAHQFTELRLGPPPALAQDPDVRIHDGRLAERDLRGAAAPSRHHAPTSR
jgi:hypothetical protein